LPHLRKRPGRLAPAGDDRMTTPSRRRGVRVTMTDETTGFSETTCFVGLETMEDGAVVEDQWAVLEDAIKRAAEEVALDYGGDFADK
jgi:hypothetical protein